MKPRIPLVRAMAWIVGSVALVAVFGVNCSRYYMHWRSKQRSDSAYQILKIIQTGPQKEALTTLYLAELMQLSIDQPMNVLSFDQKLAKKRLLSSPVIKEAEVSLKGKGAVYVDYTARSPRARISDYENIGIDEEGYLFPIHPFFSPKKLPEIHLGLFSTPGVALSMDWKRPIQGASIDLALTILRLLTPLSDQHLLEIKRVDVSLSRATSYGQRQIVVVLEELSKVVNGQKQWTCRSPRILRLSTKNYEHELGHYLVLRKELEGKLDLQNASFDEIRHIAKLPLQIVDLRIDRLAFLK